MEFCFVFGIDYKESFCIICVRQTMDRHFFSVKLEYEFFLCNALPFSKQNAQCLSTMIIIIAISRAVIDNNYTILHNTC